MSSAEARALRAIMCAGHGCSHAFGAKQGTVSCQEEGFHPSCLGMCHGEVSRPQRWGEVGRRV